MTLYISITVGIFVFSFIILLYGTLFSTNEIVRKRLTNLVTDKKTIVSDDDIDKPLKDRFFKPMLENAAKYAGRIIPSSNDTKRAEDLRKTLRLAGLMMHPAEYNAMRLIVIATTAIIFYLAGLFMNIDLFMKMMMPIMGAYGSFVALRFHLAKSITKRREIMERQLPDILDMLSVNVEAGLGFEQAMLHVINNFEGPMIDEFTITYREMSMGRDRAVALQLLGERCGIEDMKNFTGAVIQAWKLGISLKNILRTQATAIRQSRRNKVEEKAMKISVKILIPMVMFIFPVIFIMLLGPALINIMETLGG
jgi:tight adherence protein C